jgi:S-adenosylmethionine:tRNA ribosyltransferase-isomerase
MKTSDFDFDLPQELIAQHPAKHRTDSRLMVFRRPDGNVEHHFFSELPQLLREGDLLILNDTRVIPARLKAVRDTGREFEILLLEMISPSCWKAMVRHGKEASKGIPLRLLDHQSQPTDVIAEICGKDIENGTYSVRFTRNGEEIDLNTCLADLGSVPLPPYIERAPEPEDVVRYQTVFAHYPGSVAAPTAGLHFSENLLKELQNKGVQIQYVTLHVGAGTFAPVKTENLTEHPMHEEPFILTEETAAAIRQAKHEGRRVIPVGTTSMRVIESVARAQGGTSELHGMTLRTKLFIYPPSPFYVADALITNFHFPKSTLLMLVSAFASPGKTDGRETILEAYREAVRQRYRFFSYGDAMLIQ